MPSQGPNSPGSVSSTGWLNDTDSLTDDDNYATIDLTDESSPFIAWDNFPFSVSGTPTNVLVEIKRRQNDVGGGSIEDHTVELIVGGVGTGTNKANAGVDWPTTAAYQSYNFTPAQWGASGLTDTDVNASDFGVRLAAQENSGSLQSSIAMVDHVRITVETDGGAVQVMDWYAPHQPPQHRPAAVMAGTGVSASEPTLFTSPPELSWYARPSEPVRTVPQPQRTVGVYAPDPADFPPIEEITVDKWFRPTNEPVRVPQRVQPLPGVFQGDPGNFVVIEEIFPDKWWQPTAVPPRGASRAQPTTAASPGQIDPTIITMPDMDWLKMPSEPVRTVPRAQPTVTSYTTEQGQLPAIFTSWWQPTSVPVRSPDRSPVTNGSYPFVPLTVIAPFDWRQPLSEPVRATISATPTIGAYPLEAGQTASYELSWYVQASEPVRESPKAQPTTGQLPMEPSLLVVPPLDWLTQPAEVPRSAPRALPTLGELGSHEPFLPSAWVVCIEMQPPVRIEPRAQPTIGESHADPTLFLVPDLATWWQPTSVPVLEPRLPVAGMPAISFSIWIVGGAVLDVGLEWSAPHALIKFSKRTRHASKTTVATYDGEADFSELLESGELLTGAATCQISPDDGLLVIDQLAVSSALVTFRVSGGREFVRYKLTFRCATTGNGTLELVGIMHVQRS